MKPIREQCVVVCGASSGIGRSTAKLFAQNGAKVLVAARSVTGLRTLVEEIRRDGGIVESMVCDVSKTEQVKQLAEKAVELYGRIDTWVQLAAVLVAASVMDTTEEEYMRIMDVNFMGQVRATKVALPYLESTKGSLIIVSSLLSRAVLPFFSSYSASKHALQAFVETLQMELAMKKIPVSVTSILPGNVHTPFYNKERCKVHGGKYVFSGLPIGYTPDVIAESIAFASTHKRREIVVGTTSWMTDWLFSLVPFLPMMVLTWIGDWLGTRYSSPKQPTDNVDHPIEDETVNQEEGQWVALRLPFSIYNFFIEYRFLKIFSSGPGMLLLFLTFLYGSAKTFRRQIFSGTTDK